MINPVDRTDEFLTVFSSHHKTPKRTLNNGKRKRDPLELHELTQTALSLKKQIDKMKTFVTKCQPKYIDFSPRGMKDTERDEIDSAVAQFLRTAMSEIDNLKKEGIEELKAQKGDSFPVHWLGLAAILSEDLGIVSRSSESLREVRIRHALSERERVQVEYDPNVAREMAAEKRDREEKITVDGHQEEDNDMGMLEQMFERENATLVNDLIETRERVKEAEKTVVEIAQLNHIFATKVIEQAREIEVLYDLAVESTRFVDRGNKELRKMRDRGPIMKQGFVFVVLVFTFAMLFLDWMAGRKSLFFM